MCDRALNMPEYAWIIPGYVWLCLNSSCWKYLILFLVFRLNTFTNKVSNLLLRLGAEWAGGFESYPTSEIPNKYIYDVFFNDLFTYFIVVVFPLFGNSKELIDF